MSHGHEEEKKPEPKTKESFVGKNKDVVYFGKTNFRNQDTVFGIQRKDRRQHMYVVGKTGTGKSALLKNLAIQDIANGDGVCIVDPHGEFVEDMLHKIPPERIKDVIYVNPADADYHIGFNVLELPDPKYKHLVASGLMGIFTKIWSNVWSARMEYILNNAILALLDTPGSTLLGIPRLLVDKNFRQKIVNNVRDPVVKAFWIHEYEGWKDQFRGEAIAPIQNKVGQFLSTSIVRNIVGQKKSTINIFNLMNEKKILLINVSKGRIGEDNAALLGAMFITKIQLSAMERVRIPEEERQDFFLYVDEFQNFATDSFAHILSEARKYRLNLLLAHQYIGQLVTDVSTKVRDAVFGNVGTMIVFRVGGEDAEFLEREFTPELEAADIVKLANYSVYVKLMINGLTSRPFSAHTLPPLEVKTQEHTREDIIEFSRRNYCRSSKDVEREINEWSGMNISGHEEEETREYKPEKAERSDRSEKPEKPKSKNGETFTAICDNCGKTAILPFNPTPGKPVFCDDCYKKLGNARVGVKAKPQLTVTKSAPKQKMASLAALGIEFAEEAPPKPSKKHFTEPAPSKTISLKELEPKHGEEQEEMAHEKGSNLKETIGNALED